MGIKIDNKTYLNLPEQVEKNRIDIENLQGQGGYYTQEEADAKFETKVNHNTSINELKRAVRLVNQDLNSTKTNVNTNTNEIAVVKGDVNAVNTKIDQVTRDVSSLGTSVDAIDKKADQNSTDISNLGSAFNDLRTTTLSLNSSKQDKLKAGNNITISADNTISAQVDDVVLKPTDVLNSTADSDTIVRDVINDKVEFHVSNTVNNTINNKLDKPVGITDTELVGFNTEQVNIKIGNNLTYDATTNTLNATGGGGTVDAYTKAESDERYQPKGTYVVPSDLEAYEKKSDLTTTLSNYVTTTSLTTTLGDYALKTEIPTDFYTQNQCDTKFATKTELTSEASQRSDADINLAGQISSLDTRISELKTPALFQTSVLYDDTMSKQYKLFYAVDNNMNPIVSVNDTYLGFAVDGDIDETTVTLSPNSIGNPYPCIHLVDAYSKVESDEKYQPIGDYALKTEIPTDFYTKAQSDEKYLQLSSGELNMQTIEGSILLSSRFGSELKVFDSFGDNYSVINITDIGVYKGEDNYARFTSQYFENKTNKCYFPWETSIGSDDVFLSKNNASTYLTNFVSISSLDDKLRSYETTADASTAHTTLSGKIDTNTSDITKLKTDVSTMSTKLGTETILRRW